MGKGGCKSTSAGGAVAPGKGRGGDGSEVSVLEKERRQKIDAEPKFYWAHDEEPHRRR